MAGQFLNGATYASVRSTLNGNATEIDTNTAKLLGGLPDVNVPSPSDGQVLAWNNTSSMWEALSLSIAPDAAGLTFDPTGNTYAVGVTTQLAINQLDAQIVTNAAAIASPAVASVAGKTGAVTLDMDDIAADTGSFVRMTPAERTNLGNQSGTNTGDQNAVGVPYNNATSGIVATTVQGAIDLIHGLASAPGFVDPMTSIGDITIRDRVSETVGIRASEYGVRIVGERAICVHRD